ncbi:hypothetical protein [Staphylococcus capitis]|uniref:Uncharacterized protein n=1 Tax=Staphylococcus capitis TaxID=29388 RepID=A0ABX1SQT3_STACP|nr:hypothetical protein [Staphylococcus capitis]NMK53997.1 hypothetical protein [Staphylococcus capitis]NMK69310.1 hypothetical protein [Staphylococcus capitis]
MTTILLIFGFIWLVSSLLILVYVNKFLLKQDVTSSKNSLRLSTMMKSFITKDNQQVGRKYFVVLVSASIVTAVIFCITTVIIFSIYEEFIPTLIITAILVVIIYIISKKFIKALAYQIFEKNK